MKRMYKTKYDGFYTIIHENGKKESFEGVDLLPDKYYKMFKKGLYEVVSGFWYEL